MTLRHTATIACALLAVTACRGERFTRLPVEGLVIEASILDIEARNGGRVA